MMLQQAASLMYDSQFEPHIAKDNIAISTELSSNGTFDISQEITLSLLDS
jgi:hypothetical protein